MGVLRPVDSSELQLRTNADRENFVQFVSSGNILEPKDKLAVKRGRQLEYLVLNVPGINLQKKPC